MEDSGEGEGIVLDQVDATTTANEIPLNPEIPRPGENATTSDWLRYYLVKLIFFAASDMWR